MSDSRISHQEMSLNNFVFGYIKEYIESIASYDENVCYSEQPFLDIEATAIKIGIKDIQYDSFLDKEAIIKRFNIKDSRNALPEDISNEHAVLLEVNGEYIILVNNRKSKEEQRFSIAHEIEHFISKKAEKQLTNSSYLPSSLVAQAVAYLYIFYISNTNKQATPKFDHFPFKTVVKSLIEYFPNKKDTIKRRSDYLFQLKNLGKNKYYQNNIIIMMTIKAFSKLIANDISLSLNKPVSDKKTYAILYKHLKQVNKKLTVKNALYNTIAEIIEEEIADYFAVNLLVPTELFALWEDKSDNKIAQAFGVPKRCIKKRRKYEVEHETSHTISEFLTSHRNVNTSVPLKPNEMIHLIDGGHNINDARRC